MSEYKIPCPKTGAELANAARSRHPDFAAWVRAAQELRDAKRS
jgi:hypothetical protein